MAHNYDLLTYVVISIIIISIIIDSNSFSTWKGTSFKNDKNMGRAIPFASK